MNDEQQKLVEDNHKLLYVLLIEDGLRRTDWIKGKLNEIFNKTSAIDYTKAEIEEWIDSLNPTEQFVALRTIMGCTQTEIARQLGASKSRVNTIVSKLREKFK